MPSTATITAFYNFQANTKARSSEVNYNFSMFRGHSIAIDPNTATSAATETYDLGASDIRWRTGYVQSLNLSTSTTTAGLVISGDTANTAGGFLFKIGGSTYFEIDGANGFVGSGLINTSTLYGTNGTPSLISQTFTASGTFTAPAYCTNVLVLGLGGGGGGGGGAGRNVEGGGGGGAGSYGYFAPLTITPSTEYTITVGSGGAGGAGGSINNVGSNGATGGSSSFSSLVTFIGANPGLGGLTSSGGSGGAGGYSEGIHYLAGGNGAYAAGGSAGTNSKLFGFSGGAAGTYDTGGGGAGGGGASRFAAGGAGAVGNATGTSGTLGSGGGGGGAGKTGGGDNGEAGGSGGGGIVIIYYAGI